MDYNGAPPTDAFTQSCRDLIRSLTYESILACTVYVPPMVFMIGPAAVITNHPLVVIALHSLLGFGMSWTIHRMGHRLLMALPKGPQKIHLSTTLSLPVRMTTGQFVWMLEMLVAAGVCCGIAAKRYIAEDPMIAVLLIALGLVLYFLPVSLTKQWSERYYPRLALLGPTEAVINKSFPSLRSLLS